MTKEEIVHDIMGTHPETVLFSDIYDAMDRYYNEAIENSVDKIAMMRGGISTSEDQLTEEIILQLQSLKK